MVLTLMLQEKAKEVEEADAGAAVARACGVMYEQVNRRFWAASHDTCPSSLSSATPLFSDLELTPGHWVVLGGHKKSNSGAKVQEL